MSEMERWELLARMIRHPLRQRLLFEYAECVTSPSRIAAAVGEPLNVVSYHTKVLLTAGYLALVRTERRRGAREHFYRTTMATAIEDAAWGRLPLTLRRALSRGLLDSVCREAADALPQGGMDPPSTHMSRSQFTLDVQGQWELAELLLDAFNRAHAINGASRARGGDDRANYELVIMSFERASRP